MDKLKVIKITVVILTFLIVFGMLSAVGILYKKLRPASLPTTQINLSQPQGSTIESFKVINQNIYLLIKNGGKAERLIILDQRQPNRQTTISVN